MGQTLVAATWSGLALAGVLAVAGVAAGRFSRGVPHLGIGGLGAAVAVLASRLSTVPGPLALLIVGLAGAAAGVGGCVLARRSAEVDAVVWPPALLPQVAVLALALGIAGVLRPPTAIELPLGPLGGLASTAGAVTAGVVGLAFTIVGSARPLVHRALVAWALAVAGTAIAVALGAGGVVLRGEVALPAFAVPDVIGVALRAAAVGVVARSGVWQGIAAALVLGVGESFLRAELSIGEAAVLPAVLLLAWSVWQTYGRAPVAA